MDVMTQLDCQIMAKVTEALPRMTMLQKVKFLNSAQTIVMMADWNDEQKAKAKAKKAEKKAEDDDDKTKPA